MGIRFFIPNMELKQWIKDYAGDRFIVDVGAGTGEFALEMNAIGAKIMCIEPYPLFHVNTFKFISKGIQWWPETVENSEKLIKGLGKKALFLFARPCHSNFVETCIDYMDDEAEVLYITIPENVTKYQDLGRWDDNKILLDHKGTSKDEEVIYSIKK
jgi:hypothetical protein